ncbi:hypothetical protein O3P69_002632 [Scylla paramamosain]|uniref:PiggyBac transposable element-derived protein domain-containing protein n=1 Tax=Scylla paramamosain TaxID=85552 RepID=A0AAW0UMT0_SCYPA
MIESSDSDSEEDVPLRRIETKAAGRKRKRPRRLPPTISPDNIATPSTGLATSTPGPSGYSVPLAYGQRRRRADDGELLVTFNLATVKSNSGYTWHTRPQLAAARRTPARNIVVFDDIATREQRRATDKFAPVREMWDMFMANCEDNYTPHENLTVDEQLLALRGKSPFRMYIPNKPAKYGIKIVMVNDVQSKYLLQAIPYLGKAGTTTRHGLTLGHMFTKELTSRYQNTNKNVTTDNRFTSVPLIQDLLTNGLTLVATVRANKPEIPPVMREKKDRRPGTSAFLFTDYMTLVSYVPNTQTTKKSVLLLSRRKELHRRKFMHALALQLIKPSARERMNNPSQHRQVKLAIRQVCSLNLPSGTAAGAGALVS